MISVQVCVGSSCHMKGSYQVIKTFQDLIAHNNLKDEVVIKASFCITRLLLTGTRGYIYSSSGSCGC